MNRRTLQPESDRERDAVNKLRAEYGLTGNEAAVVLIRTDGKTGKGVGDVVAQVKSERVGPARDADFSAFTEGLAPLTVPGDWPGPQGTDQPPPDQVVEQLEELAEAGVRADNDPANEPDEKPKRGSR
jgi:hypothetical protein